MSSYLLTGAAGFIGYWVAQRLLARGDRVTGIDNLNDAYDPRLKHWRLSQLEGFPRFRFEHVDVVDRGALSEAFEAGPYDAVFHLAARAGAPASVLRPGEYITANATGTQNVLDKCTISRVRKLVLASTSSVYGHATRLPVSEGADEGQVRSPYAASKKAAELLAHAHHHVHGLDITVLRYFTVYGPAGRPDMSLFRFIRWIREGVPIVLHGDGTQTRDFTFVGDIARGTTRAATPLGFEVINLGSAAPVELRAAIRLIEECLGRRARIRQSAMPKVDVPHTWAAIDKARLLLDWSPETALSEGIEQMVRWYLDNRDWARRLDLT